MYFCFCLKALRLWQQPHMQSIHALTPHLVAKNTTNTAQTKSETRYIPTCDSSAIHQAEA